jgi:hypothetical protein
MSSALSFGDLETEDQQHYVEMVNTLKTPYKSDEARAKAALAKAVSPGRIILTAGKSATIYASIAAFYKIREALFPKASPAFMLCGFMIWLKLKYKRDEVDIDSFPRFPKEILLTDDEIKGLGKLAEDVEEMRLVQKMDDLGPNIEESKNILEKIMKGGQASDEDMKRLLAITEELDDIFGKK